MLSQVRMSVKGNFVSKNKRMSFEAKVNLRTKCREKLYSIEDYLQAKPEEFIATLFHKSLFPTQFNPGIFENLEFGNVLGSILCDFNFNFGPFDFTPSLPDVEFNLKTLIKKSLTKLGDIPRLNISSRILGEETYNFDFSESQATLMKSLGTLDECLAECYMPLLAFIYFMQCFTHLLLDRNNLVAEELRLLTESVGCSNLE